MKDNIKKKDTEPKPEKAFSFNNKEEEIRNSNPNIDSNDLNLYHRKSEATKPVFINNDVNTIQNKKFIHKKINKSKKDFDIQIFVPESKGININKVKNIQKDSVKNITENNNNNNNIDNNLKYNIFYNNNNNSKNKNTKNSNESEEVDSFEDFPDKDFIQRNRALIPESDDGIIDDKLINGFSENDLALPDEETVLVNTIKKDINIINSHKTNLESEFGKELYKEIYKIIKNNTQTNVISYDINTLTKLIYNEFNNKISSEVLNCACNKIPEFYTIIFSESNLNRFN